MNYKARIKMHEAFNIVLYYVLPLIFVGLLVKFILKVGLTFLWPSVIMLLLFIFSIILAPFTPKDQQEQLFTMFWIIHLVALTLVIILMVKKGVVWKHFFISLPFQLYYWITLFYYGGLLFTHKFQL